MGAAPAEIWRALTAPEWVSRWYHGAQVTGDWRAGGSVVYRLPEGLEMEAGSVVEADPAGRLELETRFLWDEEVRAEPPHRSLWEFDGSGLVRLTVTVPEGAPRAWELLSQEGAFFLRSLRLVLDPAEQAAVARLERIGDVEIRDVTPDLVGAYQRFFDDVGFRDHPQWQGCYCAEVSLPRSTGRAVNTVRDEMSALVRRGEITALLAFSEGGPVAWCNYGETTRLAGLVEKLGLEAADHERVGSVGCFVISSQYRRHGLARRLLDVACDRLRERGCTQVEAYPPRDSESDYSNYRGPLRLYLEAGFEPYREAGRTQIVRKSLL